MHRIPIPPYTALPLVFRSPSPPSTSWLVAGFSPNVMCVECRSRACSLPAYENLFPLSQSLFSKRMQCNALSVRVTLHFQKHQKQFNNTRPFGSKVRKCYTLVLFHFDNGVTSVAYSVVGGAQTITPHIDNAKENLYFCLYVPVFISSLHFHTHVARPLKM